MNKIKNLFSKMIESVKNAYNIFPITMIIVFFLTLIATFFMIGSNFSNSIDEIISHIFMIGFITAFGTWFTEVLFNKENNIKKILFYVFSFVIAVIFDVITYKKLFKESTIVRWIGEYLIVCVLSTIYVLLKKSKNNFEKYVLNVFLNLKRTGIIYGILAIGFLILYAIFTILLLDTLDFEVYLKILCLFTGFYLVPVALQSFANETAEDTNFNKTVFSKVLLPLLFLAMLIVYIYIIKILVIKQIPKNQLFMILSWIFAFAFPIYIINKNYSQKGTIFEKINNSILYLFIPLILLQIYTMGIRIHSYELTESRYMGCTLIIFEIISIFFVIFKKSKYLKEIIISIILISLITIISPWNYEKISLLSQKKIVDKYVSEGTKFDDLSEENKKKFASAYQYIDQNEELINKNLTQIEREQLSSYNFYRYNYEENQNTKSISLYKELNNIDISEYTKIYSIGYTRNNTGTILKYNEATDNIKFTIDLSEYINKIIEANEISKATAERVFEELYVVPIDENKDLFITSINCNYNKGTKNVENLGIQSYVFEK